MALRSVLRLKAVRVSAATDAGEFGHTFVFRDGLNVIRGDNTSGKSTTLQAIMYALGMEGMLSASHRIPLPHSMTEKLSYGDDEFEVNESYVELEIQNSRGDIITINRPIKHATKSTSLVTVARGAIITAGDCSELSDYFVRRAGAAQREAGFHHFLAEFIGWNLPNVTKMDGSEVPLYMETLFPYFYVEQKHGWSGVQARMPTYLGIREVGKRSAEFVLNLEIFRTVLQKQRVASSIVELEAQWREALRDLTEIADAAGVTLTRIPATVRDSLDAESAAPVTMIEGKWMALDEAVGLLEARVDELTARPVPAVKDVASELETQVEAEEKAINEGLVSVALIVDEREQLRRRQRQLNLRIGALDEDLQKHKDARTLARLGSAYASALLGEQVCPTCHQSVHDGMDVSSHVMAAEENISFIERELSTLRAALNDLNRANAALRVRERSVRQGVTDRRRRVRALRETLVSADNVPSVADVADRVAVQDRLDRLSVSKRQIQGLRENLLHTALAYQKQRELLSTIDADNLQGADLAKIAALQEYLQNQLERYGFSSLRPSEVEISPSTYRPAHEGFDLGFDLSASDMIRVIWSYLLGILRVSDEKGGNHLSLLIFDEPKQQDTAPESYRELLREAAEHGEKGSQIIFATSEELNSLLTMLGDAVVNLLDISSGEKLLRPVDSL
jgi:hypothetical protein